MRRTTAVALVALGLASAALVPTASASAAAAAKTVTVKVVGIDRSGAQVAVVSGVTPPQGNTEPTSGPVYHLKPGPYFIAADVRTAASGTTSASQTIVVRQVDVRKSGTITLDSRGGQPVSVFLDGTKLEEPPFAGACIADARGLVYSDPNGGPLYVKPMASAQVNFMWAETTRGPRGSVADLTGRSKSGLPASPVFRVRTADLVKTVIQVKAGTIAGTTAYLSATSAISPCALPGLTDTFTLPGSVTEYRSPALWTTTLETNEGLRLCSLSTLRTRESRGHDHGLGYTVALGGAARGPSLAVPVVDGKKLAYDPQYQFTAPVTVGHSYCFQSTVTLSRGGHVLARKRFGQSLRNFTATVHPGRWYTLTTDARQQAPAAELAGMLSPRTTLAWRFRLAKGAAGGVPVAVTSMQPLGLDLHNRAVPTTMTPVLASFTQGSYVLAAKPQVPVRSFTVLASFNDGRTWHRIAATARTGFYIFSVHNPASGFVSLRTVTVNAHGDSSTETIYRAYGIG